MKCISISVLQQQYFFYCYEALFNREVTFVWILKPVISHIEEETIAVAVSTYLCVVSHIFCCPITLFKGYVTWQNFTLTGPVLSAYLLYKNTDRNDKVKYTQSAFSGKGLEVRAYCFPPLPPPCLVPFPPLILPGPTCLFPSTMNYGAV